MNTSEEGEETGGKITNNMCSTSACANCGVYKSITSPPQSHLWRVRRTPHGRECTHHAKGPFDRFMYFRTTTQLSPHWLQRDA